MVFSPTSIGYRIKYIKVDGLTSLALKAKEDFTQAVKEATSVIDITANDDILRSMPFPFLNPDVPIISLSLGFNASWLFFYPDIAKTFSADNFNQWFMSFRIEETPISNQLKNA